MPKIAPNGLVPLERKMARWQPTLANHLLHHGHKGRGVGLDEIGK